MTDGQICLFVGLIGIFLSIPGFVNAPTVTKATIWQFIFSLLLMVLWFLTFINVLKI